MEPPLSLPNETCLQTTQNTLPSGSAAFIIIALILGPLSQPSGSISVLYPHKILRIWRLSPLVCALEGLLILLSLAHAPFTKTSQLERAFTILSLRTIASSHTEKPLVEYLERPKLELILPMMLQIVKVAFISGSRLTTVLAYCYWVGWVLVQYCHCLVWMWPITEEPARCCCRLPTSPPTWEEACRISWRQNSEPIPLL